MFSMVRSFTGEDEMNQEKSLFEAWMMTIALSGLAAVFVANNDPRYGSVERMLYAIGFFVVTVIVASCMTQQRKGMAAIVAAVAYVPFLALWAAIVRMS
jgi:uncharacterized membrane protein YcfT